MAGGMTAGGGDVGPAVLAEHADREVAQGTGTIQEMISRRGQAPCRSPSGVPRIEVHPARLPKDLRHRTRKQRPADPHRSGPVGSPQHPDHPRLRRGLRRGRRSALPGASAPPPPDSARERVSRHDGPGMGGVRGALRPSQGRTRLLRTPLRHPLSARARPASDARCSTSTRRCSAGSKNSNPTFLAASGGLRMRTGSARPKASTSRSLSYAGNARRPNDGHGGQPSN